MPHAAQRKASTGTGYSRGAGGPSAGSDVQVLAERGEGPPAPVRAAFAMWVTAVAAGAFETVLVAGPSASDGPGSTGETAVGVAVRLAVFTAALLVAQRMRRGHGWARTTLVLGLGAAGTASMVVEPIHAMTEGHTVAAALAEADAMDLAFGASRALHVTAVLSALVLMFLPAANSYFKLRRAARAQGTIPAR